MMDSRPIAHEFGHRLQQLDQEIHRSLAQVRQHLRELQAAEESAPPAPNRGAQSFAEVLRSSMADSAAKPSTSPD